MQASVLRQACTSETKTLSASLSVTHNKVFITRMKQALVISRYLVKRRPDLMRLDCDRSWP